LLGCVLAGGIALASSAPATDEALRMQALSAIFPKAAISPVAGKTIDGSSKPPNKRSTLVFGDAFAAEKVYRVTAPPGDETERCASAGAAGGVREVRFRIYPWPYPGPGAPAGSDLLAVVQYTFAGAKPAASCTSIATVCHLVRGASGWERKYSYTFETQLHRALQRVEMMDLTGDGKEELIVESDITEEEATSSNMHIFDLTKGSFEGLLDMPVKMYATVMNEEQYTLTLDVARTVQQKGLQFCFSRTSYAEEGKWFPAPKVTQVCYPRGRGLEKY
jgi:hypothetical protein